MISTRTVGRLLGFAAATAVFATVLALPSRAQHGGGHGATKPVQTGNLKSFAAVLTAADKHMAALKTAIATKKLNQVHEHAFAVRDTLKRLPAVSQSLPAPKRANLNRGLKTVSSLASQLDEAGDSNNLAETTSLHQKFVVVVNAIKGLYGGGASR